MVKSSDTGRMVFGEEGEFGGGGIKNKCKRHKCHLKLNLCKKSHLYRTMGKGSKIVGMVFGKGGRIRSGEGGEKNFEKNANVTNGIPK